MPGATQTAARLCQARGPRAAAPDGETLAHRRACVRLLPLPSPRPVPGRGELLLLGAAGLGATPLVPSGAQRSEAYQAGLCEQNKRHGRPVPLRGSCATQAVPAYAAPPAGATGFSRPQPGVPGFWVFLSSAATADFLDGPEMRTSWHSCPVWSLSSPRVSWIQ